MSLFLLSLLSLISTSPYTGLAAQPGGASTLQERAAADWTGVWEGRIESKQGLPIPAEGIPFRLTLDREETDWEGSLQLMGRTTPLTKLEVTESELKGAVSLFGYAGTFRFELDGDSIAGAFTTLFTVPAEAQRSGGTDLSSPTPLEPSEVLFKRLWQGQALAVPYSANLAPEQKVAGLSLLWSEVKFNFAYFDQVPDLDWDAEYLAALTRVLETESTSAYYMVLREFVAKLQDGHTGVYLPGELAEEHLGEPEMKTLRVEDTVIVTDVSGLEAVTQGVLLGQELVSIDGVPTEEYAQKYVVPYVCSSTAQDMERQVYGRALLRGKVGSELKLELRGTNREVFEVTLERGPRRFEVQKAVEYRELEGELGYLEIRAFSGESVEKAVESAMQALAHTKGLIIDIRENPGGNSGWWVMDYLVEEYMTSAWSTRMYLPAQRAWGRPEEWHQGEPHRLPGRSELYEAPVVLLTSPKTASAAEDLASVFKHTGRGTIMGEPTCGSTGQPLGFSLPGGGGARVCTKRDTYPDGSEWVGFGIEPDVLLKPTIADYRDGSDSVLEAALARLR